MTKAQWLDEGKALGARASEAGWEIGSWLVRGEQAFLPTAPTSKKAKRVYFAQRREKWLALMNEAAKVTNMADQTLRQYARVVRKVDRVEGVPFSHHIEVLRCRPIDEKGKPQFNAHAAQEILHLAKEKGWTVADTRAEAVRRFPNPKLVETAFQKVKRVLLDILKTVDLDQQAAVIDALAEELPLIKEQVNTERDEAILKTLIGNEPFDDPFDDPSIPVFSNLR